VTTTTRPEIIIEGSDDARHWREYPFRFKPGPVSRCPSWNIPHQPRLDWQMWFAAYGSAAGNPWFAGFMRRLLEGGPSVLALMAEDPFADHPPKYLRALLYDYRFPDPAAHRAGACWTRRPAGLYFPQATLEDFSRGETQN
jgi:lipase maturation factor 1